MDGFSQRDWDTGWIFPEVRAFAWRHRSTGAVKHAFPRYVDWSNWALSICGVLEPAWYGPSLSYERYSQMPRCESCLQLIGAPSAAEHPYQWKLPPIVVRKKHAPKEKGASPFNAGIEPSNPSHPNYRNAREE